MSSHRELSNELCLEGQKPILKKLEAMKVGVLGDHPSVCAKVCKIDVVMLFNNDTNVFTMLLRIHRMWLFVPIDYLDLISRRNMSQFDKCSNCRKMSLKVVPYKNDRIDTFLDIHVTEQNSFFEEKKIKVDRFQRGLCSDTALFRS